MKQPRLYPLVRVNGRPVNEAYKEGCDAFLDELLFDEERDLDWREGYADMKSMQGEMAALRRCSHGF